MPVICATCSRTFNSLIEVADHIIDTDQGTQGEPIIPIDANESLVDMSPAEIDNLHEALSGFSHRQFFDKNGKLMMEGDFQVFVLWLITGTTPHCSVCDTTFKHKYNMYLHLSETGHLPEVRDEFLDQDVPQKKKRYEEIERRYF